MRFVGQPVAAVAAVDEDTAEEALSLIDVEYEEMPAVFTAEEAMRDGAPLVHDNLADLKARSVYLASWYPVQGTNIIHRASRGGDGEDGAKKSRLCFRDEFTPPIHHCYMEPHATTAAVVGECHVWTCSRSLRVRTVRASYLRAESKMRTSPQSRRRFGASRSASGARPIALR